MAQPAVDMPARCLLGCQAARHLRVLSASHYSALCRTSVRLRSANPTPLCRRRWSLRLMPPSVSSSTRRLRRPTGSRCTFWAAVESCPCKGGTGAVNAHSLTWTLHGTPLGPWSLCCSSAGFMLCCRPSSRTALPWLYYARPSRLCTSCTMLVSQHIKAVHPVWHCSASSAAFAAGKPEPCLQTVFCPRTCIPAGQTPCPQICRHDR